MGYLSNKYIFGNVNLRAEPFLELNPLLALLKLCIKTLIVMLWIWFIIYLLFKNRVSKNTLELIKEKYINKASFEFKLLQTFW